MQGNRGEIRQQTPTGMTMYQDQSKNVMKIRLKY